jgi:hypothetical protein
MYAYISEKKKRLFCQGEDGYDGNTMDEKRGFQARVVK